MQTQDIIYQHSPQFMPKIAIKLENLIGSIYEAKQETHPIIHLNALKNVIKVLNIVDKPELKSRLTKEFLRLSYILPESLKLSVPKLYDQFQVKTQELQTLTNRFGSKLNHDPFLQSLKLKTQDQWQECELQPPYLFHWLHQKPEFRQNMIHQWMNELSDFTAVIQNYLAILRHLVIYEKIDVKLGFFQKPIVNNPLCQLIVLKIPQEVHVVPKIQFSTHALSIYFAEALEFEKQAHRSFNIEIGIVRI